jgi:glycosyltransferase involved in cell wall biosynthesis
VKVAVITCYHDPDYIRARTLRAALAHCKDVEVIVCKNSQRGVLRYPEMLAKIVWLRLSRRPDVYLLTFRAYELLPWTAFVSWPKPFICDEFINPIEWLQEPRPQAWAKHLPVRFLGWWYKLFLRRAKVILADTEAHADYSAKLLGLPRSRFEAIAVGTDETVFKPQPLRPGKEFVVFYYGTMLPLHGLSYVIEAAHALKENKNIRFRMVGGGEKIEQMISDAASKGANITYEKWIPFEQLPDAIATANISLGGPFGNTVQGNHVITGKTYQFLAQGAPTLIGESKVSVKIGANGRKLFETFYTTKAIAAQLDSVLARLS